MCAVGSPACPSQVLRTPHQSDGRFLTGPDALLRFMHRMLGSLLASELLLARVRDHFLCVALFDSSPRLTSRGGNTGRYPHFRDWRPTLFRGHQDVLQWSCHQGCHALRTSTQRNSSNLGWITFSVRSPFFARMLLDSTRFLGAGNLHGGCQNVSRRAVHAMVRGTVSDTLKIHETAVVSSPHGPIFTGESGAARIHSGPSGKIVCQSFLHESTRRLQCSSPHFPSGPVQRRQHVMSVGVRSSSLFDPFFHAEVMRRFADLSVLPSAAKVFDSLLTTSELRPLSRCVESVVGLDGLPYSLSKVIFRWGQSALVKLFNLVLAWGTVPCGSTMWLSPCSNKATHQIRTISIWCLLRHVV